MQHNRGLEREVADGLIPGEPEDAFRIEQDTGTELPDAQMVLDERAVTRR
jgi:hypothetical protein